MLKWLHFVLKWGSWPRVSMWRAVSENMVADLAYTVAWSEM